MELIFVYEPYGKNNARTKISNEMNERINADSFKYYSLEEFRASNVTPDLIILEDEAKHQMKYLAAELTRYQNNDNC